MSQAASEMGLPLSSVSRRASRSFFSLTCSRCIGVMVKFDGVTPSHAQLIALHTELLSSEYSGAEQYRKFREWRLCRTFCAIFLRYEALSAPVSLLQEPL